MEVKHPSYRFDRMEFAGALGDLGTLLPLAIGMIMVNGLTPLGIFFPSDSTTSSRAPTSG